MGQNALREARAELRRPSTRLVGSVAYFPERYGDELIPLALSILQQKPTPSTIFVKHQLLTPRNVDLVYPLDNTAGANGPVRIGAIRHENSAVRNHRAQEA
jgi:ribose transport system substrate-binding protein